jgi:DNA-binding response OmpR family regulator
MSRRTRIVLIADEEAKLAPFRKRFHRDARYQVIATTNLQEGLSVSEAMPADALVVAVTLKTENARQILADFTKRNVDNKIPLHWIADATTRRTLDADEALDLQAETLLEDTMSPDEVLALVSPEQIESGAKRPRLRLSLDSAIVNLSPPKTAAPEPAAASESDSGQKGRARLDTEEGAFELSETSLLRLVEKLGRRRADGHLRIEHKAHTAHLHFTGGRAVHATFGALEGMAALVNFAHWQEGLAQWMPQPGTVPPRTIDPNVVVGILRNIPSRKAAKT